MSEPIPESIPTSATTTSRRPLKRARLPDTTSPTHLAASEISYLMSDPSIPLSLPPPPSSTSRPHPAAPPEIVANVQGSSAGAGSGEFHVYKASRRREYERLRGMDEEARREEDDRVWEDERRRRRERDEEAVRKRRAKRNRKKVKGGEKGEGPGVVVEVPKRREEGGGEEEVVVAAVEAADGSENGITIHDDD